MLVGIDPYLDNVKDYVLDPIILRHLTDLGFHTLDKIRRPSLMPFNTPSHCLGSWPGKRLGF